MTTVKRLILNSIFVLISGNLFSQVSLNDLFKLKLGEPFPNSSVAVRELFQKKGSTMIGDFFGAKYIDYENTEFDIYGKANYRFQYTHNKLTFIEVNLEFVAPDTARYRRALQTILKEFNSKTEFRKLSQYNTLSSSYALKYVKDSSRINNASDSPKYNPIKSKHLGSAFWGLLNDTLPPSESPFIHLYTGVFDRNHESTMPKDEFVERPYYKISYPNEYSIKQTYNGTIIFLTLEIFNEKTQKAKNDLSQLAMSYKNLIEIPEDKVSLALKNGVYTLPVNINGILKLDFILDLGASDVLISPDVFMTLYRSGSIKEEDFIGTTTYQFADGSTAKSSVFYLRSLKIGNTELKKVKAAVGSSINSPLLLGQSALKMLKNYVIDNDRSLMIIKE